MTAFAQLDPIIRQWSSDRQVPLFTRYKDEDVRSFRIVGSSGTECQIWIEVGERVTVSVWDYGKRRQDLEADAASLRARLDEALSIARSWVNA
jgi:hypothetical protein